MDKSFVKIKIKSVQTIPEDPKEKFEIISNYDGEMFKLANGTIKIKYQEDVSGEKDYVTNIVSFDENEKGIVSVTRTGMINMICTYEEGKRFDCDYSSVVGTIKFTAFTTKLSNSISYEKGGKLRMEYSLDNFGIKVQQTVFSMEIIK